MATTLTDKVMPELSGGPQHQARIVANLCRVVARDLTDDPKPLREQLAKNSGMTSEQIADCPLFLTGSPNEIRERLELRREQTGIHYIVIQGDDPKRLEQFAEAIVAPLAGR